MTHENATPRPWAAMPAVNEDGVRDGSVLLQQIGPNVACAPVLALVPQYAELAPNTNAANADLIVEAVNGYDILRAENERLWTALGLAKYALSKSSFTEAEAISEAKRIIAVALLEGAQ